MINLAAIIFILIAMVSNLMDFRMDDKKLKEKLCKIDSSVTVNYFETGNYKIRYADVGKKQNPLLVFIHGAPGSLDAFNGFLNDTTLRSKYRMISIDRPGYGHSNFGNPQTDIKLQTHVLARLIKQLDTNSKPVIIGHSYGGTYAARLAMDFPELMKGIILVGAAVDPNHEKIFWISYLAKIPPFIWLVPTSMKVANSEKLTHVDELNKMTPFWNRIVTNVIILHGRNDGLVPVENALYADKMITVTNKKLDIKNGIGHLIPWTNPEFIKEAIAEMSAF